MNSFLYSLANTDFPTSNGFRMSTFEIMFEISFIGMCRDRDRDRDSDFLFRANKNVFYPKQYAAESRR